MRNAKSRTRARLSNNSPKCAELADWVADEAVWSEPVSDPGFPVNRVNAGKLQIFCRRWEEEGLSEQGLLGEVP